MPAISPELLTLTLALALMVGVTLGLLGGGGSILTVPLLVYVTGLDAKAAIATSLVVVGVTAAIGALGHAREGRVQWRTGIVFGVAGLSGAFLGGLLGGHLPGTLLLIAFAAMMLITAAAMLRGRPDAQPREGDLPIPHVIGEGLVVGLVTGLVGAGGGFLVVPALVLLGGLPMSVAVGTSLLVIALKSLGGLAGYLSSVQLDWGFVAAVTVAAVVGSLVGARLVELVPEEALRKAFAWFVLAMGVFVLVQELPVEVLAPVLIVLGVVGAGAATCWSFVSSCPLRRVLAPESSDRPLAGATA